MFCYVWVNILFVFLLVLLFVLFTTFSYSILFNCLRYFAVLILCCYFTVIRHWLSLFLELCVFTYLFVFVLVGFAFNVCCCTFMLLRLYLFVLLLDLLLLLACVLNLIVGFDSKCLCNVLFRVIIIDVGFLFGNLVWRLFTLFLFWLMFDTVFDVVDLLAFNFVICCSREAAISAVLLMLALTGDCLLFYVVWAEGVSLDFDVFGCLWKRT